MGGTTSRGGKTNIYSDCKRAVFSPPTSALEREVLFARIRTYSVRIQYISWNIAATVLLYIFPDCLLNQYIIHDKIYYNIIFHVLQFVAIFTYFLTSFMDPGYVPLPANNKIQSTKDEHDDDEERPDQENAVFIDMSRRLDLLKPWNRDITIDPDNAPTNFCWRCKFVRPIRAKHCYDCDRCVSKFDHHCPMVGNCVGGKNHRFFLFFMLVQTMVVVWAFYMSLNTLFKMDLLYSYRNDSYNSYYSSSNRSVAGWIFRIILFICLFFALFVVVGLSGFHCYLASTNQTTYEMIKPQVNEKWREYENSRKRAYYKKLRDLKKQQKMKNKSKGGGGGVGAGDVGRSGIDDDCDDKKDIDDDNDDRPDDEQDDISSGSAGNKKKKKKKRMNQPYVDFNDGFSNNCMIFCSGGLKNEWAMPLPCVLKSDSEEDSDEDSDQ